MQRDQVRQILENVRSGSSLEEALDALARQPFADLHTVKLDHQRALRCGFAEVIFAAGKEPDELVRILQEGLKTAPCMLATRAGPAHFEAVRAALPLASINERGRTIRIGVPQPVNIPARVAVVTAGTSDIPVAEEALETLAAFGCPAEHHYDVGVAGLHRVLHVLPRLQQATAIICVAGMEGALPSVVGGLVGCPVIAVPTSVGYGASLNGLAALLGMLNTCAAGVTVVNIDNGFGAAMSALRIISTLSGAALKAEKTS